MKREQNGYETASVDPKIICEAKMFILNCDIMTVGPMYKKFRQNKNKLENTKFHLNDLYLIKSKAVLFFV